jgi:hypothetical protein
LWIKRFSSLKGRGFAAAEKRFSEGVILSVAKDLLFARAKNKADPSVAQDQRDFRAVPPYGVSEIHDGVSWRLE